MVGSATLSAMPISVAPAVVPLRVVTATRYVTPLREGGSLPGLLEADDDGLYVVKFHGAGQGPKALVAELLAGELGRSLGLPVPELVLVELDPALGKAEPDQEIQELLVRSPGLNIGIDFLPGALPFDPAAGERPGGDLPDPALAADVVWFDGLVTNVDRTARNVNLLVWHRRLWLIDHGAALYIQHTWRDPAAHARRPFERIADHVLLPYAGSIAAADERLAWQISRESLEAIVAGIPADWLGVDPAAERAAHVDYLLTRLAAPRPFVEEADRARRAA
jgi:HipA-like kinase